MPWKTVGNARTLEEVLTAIRVIQATREQVIRIMIVESFNPWRSKYKNGHFEIEEWDRIGKNPATVYMQDITREHVYTTSNEDDRLLALEKLLDRSKFWELVTSRCKHDDAIVIKTNLAPASQKVYHYYTDPGLVDHAVELLNARGYSNVKIVEAQTNAILAYPELKPDFMAKKLGFKHPVHDLSDDSNLVTITYNEGTVALSPTMLDAKMIINIAKGKNHDLMNFTASLKNMYGSIPDKNKYQLYHHKNAKLTIEEATWVVNHSTPPDFTIVDMIDSVDGDEVSYFKKDLDHFHHYMSNLLFAGEYATTIDMVICKKMGYKIAECPILQKEVTSSSLDVEINNYMIDGGTLDPFPGWRRISPLTNFKAKLQDKIPVNDTLIAKGIRMYKFPIVHGNTVIFKLD